MFIFIDKRWNNFGPDLRRIALKVCLFLEIRTFVTTWLIIMITALSMTNLLDNMLPLVEGMNL